MPMPLKSLKSIVAFLKLPDRSLLLLGLLTMLACLGNYLVLPLFFGVDFLFGSIASLIVTVLYGPICGSGVAAIAGIYTIVLWGHPYSACLFILEVAFVGWQISRHQRSLVMIDAVYWLLLGMPLGVCLLLVGLNSPLLTVLVIVLKQAVNGILNALVAELLLANSPLLQWIHAQRSPVLFRHILLNFLAAFAFIPTLGLLILANHSLLQEMEQKIPSALQAATQTVVTEIKTWKQQNQDTLQNLAQILSSSPTLQPETLQAHLDAVKQALSHSQRLLVMTASGKVVAASPKQMDPHEQLETYLDTGIRHQMQEQAPILHQVPIRGGDRQLAWIRSEFQPQVIQHWLQTEAYGLDIDVTVVDHYQRIVGTTRTNLTSVYDHWANEQSRPFPGGLYQWLPTGKMPTFARGQKSYYVCVHSVGDGIPWQVILEVAAAPHFAHLQMLYIVGLGLTLVIGLLAIGLANWLSRQLLRPVMHLGSITTNLPEKILEQATLAWPQTNLAEIQSLISNIQWMANTLEHQFHTITTTNETLEQRIAERTQALQVVNQDLLVEVAERQRAESALRQSEAKLRQQASDLEAAIADLQRTQTQLIQTEKMSSLGQLVAGVAHEINNPVTFIHGNLSHALDYTQQILGLLDLYEEHIVEPVPTIQQRVEEIDLEFIQTDLPKLLQSMQIGTNRIHEIVRSLRNFSRLDEADMKAANIHDGLDSTLMILQNRLKPSGNFPGIQVLKQYADLPLVECFPGQLNQVFMNLLANAIDALEEQWQSAASMSGLQLGIHTEQTDTNYVTITISDNAGGIPEKILPRIFDPFFTTKPIGKGTGMGLAISYQIVTKRHGGHLTCQSQTNIGTRFQISIPIRQH